jgi:hypothetical protein
MGYQLVGRQFSVKQLWPQIDGTPTSQLPIWLIRLVEKLAGQILSANNCTFSLINISQCTCCSISLLYIYESHHFSKICKAPMCKMSLPHVSNTYACASFFFSSASNWGTHDLCLLTEYLCMGTLQKQQQYSELHHRESVKCITRSSRQRSTTNDPTTRTHRSETDKNGRKTLYNYAPMAACTDETGTGKKCCTP